MSIPPADDHEATARCATDEFSLVRANAINAYANFELHLALLFEVLLGAGAEKSFAVFGGLLNSRARLRIIERLMHLSCADKYDTFWDSLSSKLQKNDEFRNRVVH